MKPRPSPRCAVRPWTCTSHGGLKDSVGRASLLILLSAQPPSGLCSRVARTWLSGSGRYHFRHHVYIPRASLRTLVLVYGPTNSGYVPCFVIANVWGIVA